MTIEFVRENLFLFIAGSMGIPLVIGVLLFLLQKPQSVEVPKQFRATGRVQYRRRRLSSFRQMAVPLTIFSVLLVLGLAQAVTKLDLAGAALGLLAAGLILFTLNLEKDAPSELIFDREGLEYRLMGESRRIFWSQIESAKVEKLEFQRGREDSRNYYLKLKLKNAPREDEIALLIRDLNAEGEIAAIIREMIA
jgi:hypothetical protein